MKQRFSFFAQIEIDSPNDIHLIDLEQLTKVCDDVNDSAMSAIHRWYMTDAKIKIVKSGFGVEADS